jgi:hypothetical protein
MQRTEDFHKGAKQAAAPNCYIGFKEVDDGIQGPCPCFEAVASLVHAAGCLGYSSQEVAVCLQSRRLHRKHGFMAVFHTLAESKRFLRSDEGMPSPSR